jgi:hypothetical protein
MCVECVTLGMLALRFFYRPAIRVVSWTQRFIDGYKGSDTAPDLLCECGHRRDEHEDRFTDAICDALYCTASIHYVSKCKHCKCAEFWGAGWQ